MQWILQGTITLNSYVIVLSLWQEIFGKLRLWKLIVSVFAFSSTPELMFGLYLLYYFRVFERQIGSNKYSVSNHLVWTTHEFDFYVLYTLLYHTYLVLNQSHRIDKIDTELPLSCKFPSMYASDKKIKKHLCEAHHLLSDCFSCACPSWLGLRKL